MRDYFNLFNTSVASPQILLETIITCKRMRNQNKRGKKNTLNNVIINMRYV